MKRVYIFLAILLLIGCTAPQQAVPYAEQSAAPTAEPLFSIEVTDVAPIVSEEPNDAVEPILTPEPSPDGDLTEPEAPESVLPEGALPSAWVTDGKALGCDILVFVDGFGLGFDVDGKKASACSVTVEEKATQDVEPYETHRVLLHIGEETYGLGELRFDTTKLSEPNLYGVLYTWVVMDSDLADLEPADLDWTLVGSKKDGKEKVFNGESAGLIASFDTAAQSIAVFTAKQKYLGGEEYEFLPDSISKKTVTLTVPEDAILSIMGEEYRMLVSRDRFFALLENGYIGFLSGEEEDLFVGCELGYSKGKLKYLREIG